MDRMSGRDATRAARGAALARQLGGVDTGSLILETEQARIAQSSRRTYNSQNARLQAYLAAQHPECVVDGRVDTQQLVDDLTIFKGFILKLFHKKDAEGNDAGLRFSSLSAYRSAFNHLVNEAGLATSDAFKKSVKDFFAGLKRQDAEKRQENGDAPTVGKMALPFGLYRSLAKALLMDGRPQMLFAHCYLVLTWNLMCRSNNTAKIGVRRIQWREDSLVIYFAQTKSDQAGDRVKDPLHLYANPGMPEICPVLALAMYLSYFGSGCSSLLFPGSSQAHRFCGLLEAALVANDDLLEAFGLDSSDLGSHSIRKGVVTYTLGGSTAAPGIFSVTLRAQWKQGLVQEKYIKYQAAADQFCGRVAAGLDLLSEKFAVLPPHFAPNNAVVRDAVASVFPHLAQDAPRSFLPVLEKCLASLVFHRQWISEVLAGSSSSPILRSALFTSDALYPTVHPLCISGLSSPHMTHTGIPPHVLQLSSMERVATRLDDLHAVLPDALVTRIDGLLEERALQAGEMTPAAMRDQLRSAADSLVAEIRTLVGSSPTSTRPSAVATRVAPSGGGTTDQAALPGSCTAFVWGGAFRRVPEGWTLPSLNVSNAWRLWMLGEPANGVPPLRGLSSQDIGPGKCVQRRFAEWTCLFRKVEEFLRARGCFQTQPTAEETQRMFSKADEFFLSRCKGKRPYSVLTLSTVSRKYRKYDDSDLQALLAGNVTQRSSNELP